MNKTLLMLLLICLLSRSMLAQELNSNESALDQDTDTIKLLNVLPGGILYLKTKKFESTDYWAKLGQTRTIIIRGNDFDEIYAGVNIKTIPGEYLLTVETSKAQLATHKFVVPIPEKSIFIDNAARFFTGAPLSAIQELSNSLLWSNVPPKFPLIFPVEGVWSETIGHFYENKIESSTKKNRHNVSEIGIIDHVAIELSKPTSVLAPSDAVCFSITFDPNHGYSVILDHGMGLFSEITGLTNLTITEQDRVKQGAVIANFNTASFLNNKDKPKNRTVRWRTFLNKSIINPYQLIQIK